MSGPPPGAGRAGVAEDLHGAPLGRQLGYHLGLAKKNGATEQELIEAITHLAFYAGWPKAMSAMSVAKKLFQPGSPDS